MPGPAAKRIQEVPAPAAKEAGWYPDPLGGGRERYWDRCWHDFTRAPGEQMVLGAGAVANGSGSAGANGSAPGFDPAAHGAAANGNGGGPAAVAAPEAAATGEARRPRRFHPLSLVRIKPPGEQQDGEQPLSRAERRRRRERAERKREFFASPAGRARLAFGQKQEIFQCHLPLTRPELVVIPSVKGSAPRITADPVHILNSVVAEGWKLIAGQFFCADGVGVVGYYLFKRSEKRYRRMNDPWKGEPEEIT